jgi:uncharacterized membrane-anchored protein
MRRFYFKLFLLPLCCMLFALNARAEQEEGVALSEEERKAAVEKIFAGYEAKLTAGKVALKDNLASLNLTDEFRYLPPAEADNFLSQVWGNPPGAETLGMIFPTTENVKSTWAVIVTYSEDGYVSDKDATTINYDSLLKDMKSGEEEVNQERKEEGYPAVHLVGWAEQPTYNQAEHKLFWAKELEFEGEKPNTLNYNVRALGRHGVLVLNAVASMDELPAIRENINKLLPLVQFEEGKRYADFSPSVDKVAGYGLAALVGGTIASKAGFFKVL